MDRKSKLIIALAVVAYFICAGFDNVNVSIGTGIVAVTLTLSMIGESIVEAIKSK